LEKNYYAILRLPNFSDINAVKKNFRELALKFHPDKCRLPNATELFIEINEAYQILSNEKSKSIYDNELKNYLTNTDHITTANQEEFSKYRKEAYNFAFNNSKLSFEDFKSKVIDKMLLAYDTIILIFKILSYIAVVAMFVWVFTL